MRTFVKGLLAALLPILVAAGTASAQYTDKLYVEGARIIPVSGEEIEKGSILIENGKIVALGADVEKPFDAKVIDASGKVVFPGFVDPMTSGGLDVPNENIPVSPFVHVLDAIDASDEYYENALRNGLTTLHVSQGTNTVVSGVSMMIRPIGMTVSEMAVQPEGGLVISLSPRRGYDHSVQLATLRGAFLELDRDLERLAEKLYEEDVKKKGEEVEVGIEERRKRGRELIRPSKIEDKYRNLWRLREGKLDAWVWAERAMDVDASRRFLEERKFDPARVTMVIGSEAHRAAARLKGLSRPVILPDASVIHREIDRLTLEDEDTFVPGVLRDAGVPFALAGVSEPWYAAARLVRNGIPRQEALAAVTLNAARAIGLEHRVGSLEVGKDGNLLILSGDPLDTMTWVEEVIIEGRRVYEQKKDLRLRRLLQGVYETRMEKERAERAKAAASKAGEAEGKKGEDAAPAKKTETAPEPAGAGEKKE